MKLHTFVFDDNSRIDIYAEDFRSACLKMDLYLSVLGKTVQDIEAIECWEEEIT
jgi:hypothetical protein